MICMQFISFLECLCHLTFQVFTIVINLLKFNNSIEIASTNFTLKRHFTTTVLCFERTIIYSPQILILENIC